MAHFTETAAPLIEIRLSSEENERLERVAFERNITVPELATEAVAEYLSSLDEEVDAAAAIARMNVVLDHSLTRIRETRTQIQGDFEAIDRRSAQRSEAA